jgi:hypothetical protein
MDLKSLCGFYCIVYESWTGTENGFDIQNGDAYNYLKLSIDSSEPLDKGASEKVTGSFRFWDKIGTFGALVRDEGETENCWAMDKVEWSEIPEDDEVPGPRNVDEDDIKQRQCFGHDIAILKTLDDRGYPFIELNYNMGPKFDSDIRMVKAVGKKQKNDKGRFGLTTDEAERLMEDVVGNELEGLGLESQCDSEDEDNEQGKSALLVVNQSESTEEFVTGTKRKAEDQVDDSMRRSAPRKD